MTLPRIMKVSAGLFFLLTIVFILLSYPPAAITCGTFFYHFAMRLAVGYIVNGIMHNRADYTRRWFQLRGWEHTIYKKLHVRTWKNKLPTYNPSLFDTKKHSLSQIVQATCQSEIVHEIIAVFSFLPLFGAILFGDFIIFLLTSIFSAGFDLCFVIIQRYNRPRLIRLLHKAKAEERT